MEASAGIGHRGMFGPDDRGKRSPRLGEFEKKEDGFVKVLLQP
jgi:hypothetical protein